MVIRPRAVAALILPLLAAPAAGWGFNADATQRLHQALLETLDQYDQGGLAVDLEPLRQALAAGADPNAPYSLGGGRQVTPLAIAASMREVGVIRLLLEQKVKAEVNDSRSGRVGASRFTALHCAIAPFVYRADTPTVVGPCARAVPAVRALLEAGADVDAAVAAGVSAPWPKPLAALVTALMAAAEFQNPGLLKLLLAHGADPSRADRFRKTALQLAPAGSKTQRALQDWLGQGRPRVAVQAGAAPAASRPESKAVAPVESKARPGAAADPGPGRPSTVDENFVRAFLMGLRDDQFLEAKRHLDAGADVNFAFARGRTLLMLVAGRDPLPERLASLLLTHEKLQVDRRDEEDRTALMVAARKGHAGLVETLLALGADPGLKDRNGDTALSLAAPDSKARQALQAVLD